MSQLLAAKYFLFCIATTLDSLDANKNPQSWSCEGLLSALMAQYPLHIISYHAPLFALELNARP